LDSLCKCKEPTWMNSDYVSIDLKYKGRSWRWYEFAGWLCLCAFSIVGIHTTIVHFQSFGGQEFQLGTDMSNLNPNAIDWSEEAVGKKLTPVNDLSPEQPRLFVIAFECQPEQVEFVQHLITNVALLANENRDIPDATGQAETFISYEAFASTRPVASCDQLFLVEAYPNEASQRIHGRAAYKNGLEIMQVLRGTKPENGLPGFNFAKKGLMKTYSCESDCRAEIRQVKLELIRAVRKKKHKNVEKKEKKEKKKEEAGDAVHVITGGIGGHEVTTYQTVKQKAPEEMMTEKTRKEFVEKKENGGKKKEEKKTVVIEGNPEKFDNEEREEDLAPLTHHLRGSASEKTRKQYVKRVYGRRYEDEDQEPAPQQEVSPMVEYGGIQDQPMIIHEKHERQIIPVHAEDVGPPPPEREPRGEIIEDDQPEPRGAGEIVVVREGERSQPEIVHMLHHQVHHRYEDDDMAHEHHENHVIYSREDPDSSESHAEHSQHVVYTLEGNDRPPKRIIERHIIREAGGE